MLKREQKNGTSASYMHQDPPIGSVKKTDLYNHKNNTTMARKTLTFALLALMAKKNKKLIILAIAILTAGFVHQAQATAYWGTVVAPTGQTLYWSLVGGNKISIVCPGIGPYFPWSLYGVDFQKPAGALVIPDSVTYNGNAYPVKYIYKYAFSGCDSLTSVVLPDGVEWIMDSAFYGCTQLATVHLPDSLKFLDKHVFENCSSLTSIVIPDRITVIQKKAFCRCTSLASVTFNDSLKYIYDSAFAECHSLTSVTIPEAVVHLGLRPFAMCTSLTTIVFNAENCIYSGGRNRDYAPFYACSSVTTFTAGNRVKRIPDYFCHRISAHLSSVTLGDSVAYIGKEAFIGDSLTTIIIPASVTYIGERAFSTNFHLDTVYMMSPTPPELGGNAFAYEASGRVFILNGCSYDNYYTEDPDDNWYAYHTALRGPIIDINVSVTQDDVLHGTASIIAHGGRDVRCDSTIVVEAIANPGYHFSHWSNGNSTNPDTLQLVGDTSLIAYFVADTGDVSITLVEDGTALVAYPNPFRQRVTIQVESGELKAESGVVTAWLTDLSGRREEVRLIPDGPGQYTLDLTSRPQTTYLLTLTTADGKQHTVRLLKQSDIFGQ